MEIQQTKLYSQYILSLGWKALEVDDVYLYCKYFPIIGGLAKIQRSDKLPNIDKLITILKKERIKTIAVEPSQTFDQNKLVKYVESLKSAGFRINSSPFLPTKTLRINLEPSEDEIFKNFNEAKRRAVRRAIKNEVTIQESDNINNLIKIKNKSGGFFGFITTYGIDKLWPIFAPQNSTIVLAYDNRNMIIGGVLLLYHNNIAYYWIAGSSKYGKKLFAPTLLVWEAIKLAKKRGMKQFDFIGVWDERIPKDNSTWKGFTKFKEGFGGDTLYYPITIFKKSS